MDEDDLLNLQHAVSRHEDAATQDAKDIAELKVDVKELLNLVRLLSVFVSGSAPTRGLAMGIRHRDSSDATAVRFRQLLGSRSESLP